jgi:GTP-binding protein
MRRIVRSYSTVVFSVCRQPQIFVTRRELGAGLTWLPLTQGRLSYSSAFPLSSKTSPLPEKQRLKRKQKKLLKLYNPETSISSSSVEPSSVSTSSGANSYFEWCRGISEEERLRARRIFAPGNCRFLISCTGKTALPPEDLPEFTFAGRSNVGKSSLLNALMENSLARISKTPGRTQTINFFEAVGAAGGVRFVDLPGYGWAAAPTAVRNEWIDFVQTFLVNRSTLKVISLLLDSRHGVTKRDEEVMDLLNSFGIPYQLVLTKADKISAKEVDQMMSHTKTVVAKFPYCASLVHLTSTKEKSGIAELRVALMQIAKL